MSIGIISTVFLIFGIICAVGFLLLLITEFGRLSDYNGSVFKIVYIFFGAFIFTSYLFCAWYQHFSIKENIKTVQELPTSAEGYVKYSAIKFNNTLSFYAVFDKELKALFEKNDKRFKPYLTKKNANISYRIANGIEKSVNTVHSNIFLICCTIIIVLLILATVASLRKVSR
ncbi:MAG: hypothetical protein JXK07_13450 [Spirochaetes bacterium]|nr:hypothetical protein [Spirochaetota bacterium]